MKRQVKGSLAKDGPASKASKKSLEPVRDKAAADDVGLALENPTRVFISYRRDDTGAAAAHLRDSMGKSIGAEKIFRDLDTIQPGQNFETAIQEAIRGTSVCLVLIGPQWLTLKDNKGRRRLDAPGDYVRAEVEAALRLGVEVIPLLVDGAKMPGKKDLPESILELAVRNAYELPWVAGITKLTTRIGQIERQREAREAAERDRRARLDLTGGKVSVGGWQSESAAASFNVVTRAMEISLKRQGQEVVLDTADIAKSFGMLGTKSFENGYMFNQLRHVIDFVGVKANNSSKRYIARSYPVRSFAEVPAQLELGRPILTGVAIHDFWFKEPVLTTGMVEFQPKGAMQGGVTGAVLGWDPSKEIVRILMPWFKWGKSGMGMLTQEAAEKYLLFDDACSIEPVLMPESPFPVGKSAGN
jgi:hypothetical protein